jgi:hypothetical protein
MPATYEPIATQTLATAIADVDFNSIPQTYTDLVLVMNVGCASNTALGLRMNSDTGTNYGSTSIEGNGTSARSDRYTGLNYMRLGFNATFSSNTVIDQATINIFDYTNTTTNKAFLNRLNSQSQGVVHASVGRWLPGTSAAITSINILNSNGVNFIVGSTFTLYGIKAA